MRLSLPPELKRFAGAQAAARDEASAGAYVRALIRRDRDRQGLRTALLEGAASGPGRVADAGGFAELRARARAD